MSLGITDHRDAQDGVADHLGRRDPQRHQVRVGLGHRIPPGSASRRTRSQEHQRQVGQLPDPGAVEAALYQGVK